MSRDGFPARGSRPRTVRAGAARTRQRGVRNRRKLTLVASQGRPDFDESGGRTPIFELRVSRLHRRGRAVGNRRRCGDSRAREAL